MSEAVQIPRFDESARKFLLVGYVTRIFSQIIPYVGGVSLIITSFGWLKHYMKIDRRSLFMILAILLFASGALHIYVDYGRSQVSIPTPSMAPGGKFKLSDLKALYEITYHDMMSYYSLTLYGLLGLAFVTESMAFRNVIRMLKEAFVSILWILILVMAIVYLALVPITFSVAAGLSNEISGLEKLITEEGDREISDYEFVTYMMRFVAIMLPALVASFVAIALRIISSILAAWGMHKVSKVIAKMRILAELERRG